MKKILSIPFLFLFLFFGCNDKKKKENEDKSKSPSNGKNLNELRSIPVDSVKMMADNYRALLKEDPTKGIQQINMAGAVLKGLTKNLLGIKLINAADPDTKTINVILEFWKGDKDYTYYYITDFFNSSEPGMRNQPVLCPPPDGCGLPTSDLVGNSLITEKKAQQMADAYNKLVKEDPDKAIRQVNMDSHVLDSLMTDTQGFKVVYAATETGTITAVLQFCKHETFTYYDISRFFNETQPGMRSLPPICPPPKDCDIPLPAIKSK
jgi:hypothetical protein